MNRKGLIFAGVFAILFVPGTIPALLAMKTAKYRKKRITQKQQEEE
jgi:hypothetical protein